MADLLRAWVFAVLVVAFVAPATAQAPADGVHRLVLYISESDTVKMNGMLDIAANVSRHYSGIGEEVEIEIVAFAGGLHMLRADTSPVKDRIAAMSLANEHLKFSACGNTLSGMTRKEGKAPTLISEARIVPSGVVRLMELQGQGWTYVRP